MKKISCVVVICFLAVVLTGSIVFAAANPVIPSSALPSAVTSPDAAPAEFLQAIKTMRDNKFSENDIKSFVYQVFSLLDKHVDVKQLLFLFADENLVVTLPEGPINSQEDFERWYSGLGAKYQSNIHVIEKLSVTIPAKSDYRIDAIVRWEALGRDGKFTSQRVHHQWKVVDGGGYWPRIVSYNVEAAL